MSLRTYYPRFAIGVFNQEVATRGARNADGSIASGRGQLNENAIKYLSRVARTRRPFLTCCECGEPRTCEYGEGFCENCERRTPTRKDARIRERAAPMSRSGVWGPREGDDAHEERVRTYMKRHRERRDIWTGEKLKQRRRALPFKVWKGAAAVCFCGRTIKLNLDGSVRGHGPHISKCEGSGRFPVLRAGRLVVERASAR